MTQSNITECVLLICITQSNIRECVLSQRIQASERWLLDIATEIQDEISPMLGLYISIFSPTYSWRQCRAVQMSTFGTWQSDHRQQPFYFTTFLKIITTISTFPQTHSPTAYQTGFSGCPCVRVRPPRPQSNPPTFAQLFWSVWLV